MAWRFQVVAAPLVTIGSLVEADLVRGVFGEEGTEGSDAG
jgi:hypothetical protein